jgi:hypothetical protein
MGRILGLAGGDVKSACGIGLDVPRLPEIRCLSLILPQEETLRGPTYGGLHDLVQLLQTWGDLIPSCSARIRRLDDVGRRD